MANEVDRLTKLEGIKEKWYTDVEGCVINLGLKQKLGMYEVASVNVAIRKLVKLYNSTIDDISADFKALVEENGILKKSAGNVDAQQAVADFNEQIEAVKAENAELKSDKEKLELEKQYLESEKNQLEEKIAELTDISKINAETPALTEQEKADLEQLNLLKNVVEKYKLELEKEKSRNEELSAANGKLNDENKALLNAQESEKATVSEREELENCRAKLNECKQLMDVMSNENKKLSDQLASAEKNGSVAEAARVSELESKLKSTQNENYTLVAKVSDLKRELEDTVKRQVSVEDILIDAKNLSANKVKAAEEQAERIINEANAKLTDAQARADIVISEANTKAELTVHSADDEAKKLLNNASVEASTMLESAKSQSEMSDSESKSVVAAANAKSAEILENARREAEAIRNSAEQDIENIMRRGNDDFAIQKNKHDAMCANYLSVRRKILDNVQNNIMLLYTFSNDITKSMLNLEADSDGEAMIDDDNK